MGVEVINIRDLTAGTTVRVVFRSSLVSKLFKFNPPLRGFGKSLPGDPKLTGIPAHSFRRVFGFNRRDFLAQILANDTVERTLALEIQDTQPRRGKVYYRMVVPWSEFFKMSKLVPGGNPTDDEEEERKRRQQRRRIGVDFFHPFDAFAPIDLVG